GVSPLFKGRQQGAHAPRSPEQGDIRGLTPPARRSREPSMSDQPKRGVLLALAAEGVIPVLGGCAGALAGGPEAGVVGGVGGGAVGQAFEKVITFCAARIVYHWTDWFRKQPPEARAEALSELASLPAEEARQQAAALLDHTRFAHSTTD